MGMLPDLGKSKLDTLSQADLAARQVRVLLADVHAMLGGDRLASEARTYTIDAALADYLELLDGTPTNGMRSRTSRLDALLGSLTSTLLAAGSLDDSLLGGDAVPGVGSSLLSGGVIGGAGLGDFDLGAAEASVSEQMGGLADARSAISGRPSLPDPRGVVG